MPERGDRTSPRRTPRPGGARQRARGLRNAEADAWRIELQSERSGVFFYTYRRLRVERLGRRASVREFTFHVDLDTGLNVLTRPRRAVRQRGRSLSLDEAERLWRRVVAADPDRFEDAYPCLDDTRPEDLDPSQGPDRVPVAVATGEEGPACLTLRVGRERERRHWKRVVIDRCRAPAPAGGGDDDSGLAAPEADRAARPPAARSKAPLSSPLTSIVRAIDPGLKTARAFNYRKCDTLADLSAEFNELKALAFLNLRGFERRCVEALGRLGDPRALPPLLSELFASDPIVRLGALDALAAIGDESAIPEVELLSYDDHPEVRERARWTLDLLGRDTVLPHSS